MKRTIPLDLYNEVYALVTVIAQPYAEPLESVDEAKSAEAYGRLKALFERRKGLGESDPFLTEALADFTEDPSQAIVLYELALKQCSAFPGEPKTTKRIGLARLLIAEGRQDEAREQVVVATQEAFSDHDDAASKELEVLRLASLSQKEPKR